MEKSKTAEYFEAVSWAFPLGKNLCLAFGFMGLVFLRSTQLLTLQFDVIYNVLGFLIATLDGEFAGPKLPLEICKLFPFWLLEGSPSTALAACV